MCRTANFSDNRIFGKNCKPATGYPASYPVSGGFGLSGRILNIQDEIQLGTVTESDNVLQIVML